jgi:hypothetical protein
LPGVCKRPALLLLLLLGATADLAAPTAGDAGIAALGLQQQPACILCWSVLLLLLLLLLLLRVRQWQH